MSLPPERREAGTAAFTYDSLDLSQKSIRLIRVLPDLSEHGLTQCEIRHASIESDYTCLSYVWGQPSHNWIILGGQPHSIRDNLASFLQLAQRKPITEWLWIDALCINQIDVAERTHQVQQMGLIFSKAHHVIAWLGADKSVAGFLRHSVRGRSSGVIEEFVNAFLHSAFWTRAWITQELILARRVTIMADNTELSAEELPPSVAVVDNRVLRVVQKSPFRRVKSVHVWPHCFLGDVRGLAFAKGQSLPYLLSVSSHKQCAVPRDRIFSLLSLCGEGSDIPVNYDSPPEDLARSIITKCRKSFCLCSMVTIFYAVDMDTTWSNTPLEVLWQRYAARLRLCSRVLGQQNRIRVSGTKEIFTNIPIYESLHRNPREDDTQPAIGANEPVEIQEHRFQKAAEDDIMLCDCSKGFSLFSRPEPPHAHISCRSSGSEDRHMYTIAMRYLCQNYRGYISLQKQDIGVRFRHLNKVGSGRNSWLEMSDWHIFPEPMHTEFSDNDTCRLEFPLRLLHRMGELASRVSPNSTACCDRVAGIETEAVLLYNSCTSGLELCEIDPSSEEIEPQAPGKGKQRVQ